MPSPDPDSAGTRITDLLRRFAEETSRLTAVFGDRHGLSPRDLSALAVIAEAAERDRPVGPARLAEQIAISPSGATALVDRLEVAGHVVRRPDVRDRRRTVLVMQPRAHELARAFFDPLSRALDDVIAARAPDQLELIADFLRSAVDAVADSWPPDDGTDRCPPAAESARP